MSFLSCGRSAVVPVIFSRNTFSQPARLQLGKLASEVLGVGRDAGITVNHARILHRKFAPKKRIRSESWF
jgi:hypothetical protein